MFGKPGGPSGMEMLLVNAIKSFGIDPAEVTKTINSLGELLGAIAASQSRIEKQNARIMARLKIGDNNADDASGSDDLPEHSDSGDGDASGGTGSLN